MTIDWPKFAEIIHSNDRFLLTSHIRPDCDALGSELGMAGVLEALGKEVIIVNGQETPPNLAFIDPDQKIKTLGVDVSETDLADVDVLMILDTSAWAQLGPMSNVIRSTTARKIVVDHHVSEDKLEAEPFKDTTAEATGRLVQDAARHLNVQLTPQIATSLYAAIATDTGWFRFPSVTPGTYQAVAELQDAGANPTKIYADLYEQDSIGRVRLRGLILARVQSEMDGRLVHTYVLKEDFERAGALPSDTEDVINMALAIAGTEFAVIVVEQLSGGCKISFRSRCDVQCNRLAEQFGGGGHKAAAGAFIQATQQAAMTQVLDAVRSAMQ